VLDSQLGVVIHSLREINDFRVRFRLVASLLHGLAMFWTFSEDGMRGVLEGAFAGGTARTSPGWLGLSPKTCVNFGSLKLICILQRSSGYTEDCWKCRRWKMIRILQAAPE